MSNDNNVATEAIKKTEEGVEKKDGGAPAVGEEKVTISKAEMDKLITAAESATQLAEKKSADAENYKKGMMIAKGKLKDNGIEDIEESPRPPREDLKQMIQEAIKEIVPQISKPKEEDDEAAIAKQKLEEMRLVIANSRKTLSSAAGSNVEKNDSVKTEAEKYFSPEQIAEIKQKFPNADIETIYKNLPKAGDMQGAPRV